MDKDTLITISQGIGGVALSFWEVLTDILRIGILIATLTHIIVKIIKDYREKSEYFKTMAIKAEGAIEVLLQIEKDKDG